MIIKLFNYWKYCNCFICIKFKINHQGLKLFCTIGVIKVVKVYQNLKINKIFGLLPRKLNRYSYKCVFVFSTAIIS